jgi:hypothetical protein
MRLKRSVLIVLMLALLMLAATVRANGPSYTLTRWTVDGGGVANTTQGGYTLSGAAGQPDAHVWSDEGYTLVGGFWASGVAWYRVYLPLVLRSY